MPSIRIEGLALNNVDAVVLGISSRLRVRKRRKVGRTLIDFHIPLWSFCSGDSCPYEHVMRTSSLVLCASWAPTANCSLSRGRSSFGNVCLLAAVLLRHSLSSVEPSSHLPLNLSVQSSVQQHRRHCARRSRQDHPRRCSLAPDQRLP